MAADNRPKQVSRSLDRRRQILCFFSFALYLAFLVLPAWTVDGGAVAGWYSFVWGPLCLVHGPFPMALLMLGPHVLIVWSLVAGRSRPRLAAALGAGVSVLAQVWLVVAWANSRPHPEASYEEGATTWPAFAALFAAGVALAIANWATGGGGPKE